MDEDSCSESSVIPINEQGPKYLLKEQMSAVGEVAIFLTSVAWEWDHFLAGLTHTSIQIYLLTQVSYTLHAVGEDQLFVNWCY